MFTHPEAPEIDQAQYATGDGPCLDAFRHDRVVEIGSTATRYPEFVRVARQHGICSTLSLPRSGETGPMGAMNLYADTEHAFSEATAHTASLLALQAGCLLANAQAYWDARTLSENLKSAMESRSIIEQAKGIIMGAQRVGSDRAFEILRAQSQHENIKLCDIAQQIVDNSTK